MAARLVGRGDAASSDSSPRSRGDGYQQTYCWEFYILDMPGISITRCGLEVSGRVGQYVRERPADRSLSVNSMTSTTRTGGGLGFVRVFFLRVFSRRRRSIRSGSESSTYSVADPPVVAWEYKL